MREHETSSPDGLRKSVVELQIDDEEACRGLLVEMTPQSATIDFPLEKASSLLIGESYWMTFTGGRANSSIRVLANILYRGEDEHRCRYRFEISIEDSIAITTLIEHRCAMRVQPADGQVIGVDIQGDGLGRLTAALDSISVTGASIVILPDDGLRMPDEVTLGFRLPDQADEIRIRAALRNRTQRDEDLRLGFEFLPDGAVDYLRRQHQIETYIMCRQVELLRDLRCQRLADAFDL